MFPTIIALIGAANAADLKCGCSAKDKYIVKSGDSVYNIAVAKQINPWTDVCKCNSGLKDDCSNISVGQTLDLPCKKDEDDDEADNDKCGCDYTVVSGDSIFGTIWPKLRKDNPKLDWKDICNCNGGEKDCAKIFVGQELRVPCADKKKTPSPTPPPTEKPKPSPTPPPTEKPKPSPTPPPTEKPKPSPTPPPTEKPKPSPTPPPTQKPKTPSPTPPPTQKPKPSPTPPPSAAPAPKPRSLPVLTGPVTRDYWTKTQLDKDGTYYGEWDPAVTGRDKVKGHKAMTRKKILAVGACGLSGVGNLPAFGKVDPTSGMNQDVMPIAVSTAKDYDNSLACGMCVEYKGTGKAKGGGKGGNDPIPQKWAKGIIVDGCAGCHKGDFDLATVGDGRWYINWRAVDCNVGSSKFEYIYTGSHNWYIKLQIRNHKVPVYKVEMLDYPAKNAAKWKKYTNKWVPMKRTIDNHFMANSGAMTRPYNHVTKFRITSIFGEVVYDEVDTVSNTHMKTMNFNNPTTGKVQFDKGSYGAKNNAARRLSGDMILSAPDQAPGL